MTQTAVHFGAGNIGRGFIGLALHEAGYDLVFSDVNAELVVALNAADSYAVHEVGAEARTHTVDRFRAVNSATNEADAVAAVAGADIATCAVGAGVLKFIAPVIREGLRERAADAPKLVVLACENAINATDTLRDFVLDGAPELADRAIFANTAVDRIIPAVHAEGLDVVVEDFSEWAIERGPFAGAEPSIPDAHFVDDLAPYIRRKLFTVNTGHATAAYWGSLAGEESIASALGNAKVREEVDAVLAETSELLIAQFGFGKDEHAAYVARTIQRFENPELPDTPTRIGRQPLRKLSRHERFIEPAFDLATRGLEHGALLRAVGAALQFRSDDDEQSQELGRLLETLEPEQVVAQVMGVEPGEVLHDELVEVVRGVDEA
jgi:mannitol-1-phosphate 5-dehydrogenase